MQFYKYHGAGNDFIILDNRNGNFSDISTEKIRKLCSRRYGIGSDGLILLSPDRECDFSMVFYNPDGSGGTFCGNGARCITAFAYKLKIIENSTIFRASDGLHTADIIKKDDNGKFMIRVKMSDVSLPEKKFGFVSFYTGSPHVVQSVKGLSEFNVNEEGRKIRYSDIFAPAGTNVNFIEPVNKSEIKIRTYERGVEHETFSCGTGVTASALAHAYAKQLLAGKIAVKTLGGNFVVYFKRNSEKYTDILLEGPVEFVYKGVI